MLGANSTHPTTSPFQAATPIRVHAVPFDVPWIALGPTRSFKPLRFLGTMGWAQLLRVEPGTVIARHRHRGEVHGLTLQGQRLLDTGEIVGPGGYVYEPPGNIDSWSAIGDVPLIVHTVVLGAVEYLSDDDRVIQRIDAAMLAELYRQHCERLGLPVLDLGA